MVRNLKDAVGEIDLLHLNNSKDDFNSSRDRHENILIGKINPEYLLEVIVEADTDTVVETPGGELAQREDVRYIRAELNKPFLNM
jgi:deoxyribonuclease-4